MLLMRESEILNNTTLEPGELSETNYYRVHLLVALNGLQGK